MIINKGNSAELFTGFRAEFQKGFAGVTPTWPKLAELVPSSTDKEEYPFFNDAFGIRKWVGERVAKKMEGHKYSIENESYEGMVRVPVPAIEDDKYGVYGARFRAMAKAIGAFPDKLLYGLIKKGDTELCYDGKPFFSAAHKVGKENISNWGAGAGALWVLLDTQAPMKPLVYQERKKFDLVQMDAVDDEARFTRNEIRYGVDGRCAVGFGMWQQAYGTKQELSAANFNLAMEALIGMKNDEGDALGIMPNVLLVGATNRAKALEIVKAERLDNGKSNINQGAVEVIVTPYL